MRIALFCIAAFFLWGSLRTIADVGKPRKTVAPGVAAVATLLSAVIITIIVIAALQLH